MRALVTRQGLGLLVGVAVALAATAGCADDAEPDGSGGNGTTGGGPSWCEVSQVLEAKCRRCHVGEGLNGAPFPLVTYADTQVENAVGPRWERMWAMVEDDLMPPSDSMLNPPVAPLTADEKDLLLEWFATGAEQVGTSDCN
jgi:hypothetical protein